MEKHQSFILGTRGIIAMTQTARHKSRWGAQIGVFALVLMLVVALTGCVRIDRNIHVNDDGSGTYALTIGFKRDLATTMARR